MGRIEIDDCTVNFEDSYNIKVDLFDKLLNWFIDFGAFDGEVIWQSDTIMIKAPELLTEIAEKFFKFKVEWKD